MKIHKIKTAVLALSIFLYCSCSKSDDSTQETVSENEVLKFSAINKAKGTVLFSEWIPSGFPNSSLSGSEFFSFPLIEEKYFDIDKDLIIFYGKRNSISQIPVTLPVSRESYMVELAPTTKGTIPLLRVTSLQWATEALQDIFFSPKFKAQFRVVIIPGEEKLNLLSSNLIDLKSMTYEEITSYLTIPE